MTGDGQQVDPTGPEQHDSPFDAIRQTDADGNEYWSARALADALGYIDWRNFQTVILQAQIACEASGHAVSDHFVDVNEMITLGKGGRRKISNTRLSRYACYLAVQNADPEKPIVAQGQTYFAEQTRRQELTQAQLLERMTEDQQRLFLQSDLTYRHKLLSIAAGDAGVTTQRDFAIFYDHGYQGLYDGQKARDIAIRLDVGKNEPLSSRMGGEELAANLFRATQTQAKLKRDNVDNKADANRTHFEVGRAVRKAIAELGGTMPEGLPPAEPIKQVEQRERDRLAREAQARRQPTLFGESTGDETTE